MQVPRSLTVRHAICVFLFAACAPSNSADPEAVDVRRLEPTSANDNPPCSPTFLALPPGPINVESGNFVFSLNYLIIGCKRNLEGLDEADQAAILDLLVRLTKKRNLTLLVINEETAIRLETAERINQHLGMSVVSDVYFYLRSVSESW